MAPILDQLKVVRLKIGRHIHNAAEGKDGVLTHSTEEYLNCLDLNHRKLSNLMIADAKHWDDHLENTKLKAR